MSDARTELPTVREERCETCRYARPLSGNNDGWVECHRYAPRPTHKPPEDDDGTAATVFAYWPELAPDDFCGEWRGKDGPGDVPIKEAGFSVRTLKCLNLYGDIATLRGLTHHTADFVAGLKGSGATVVQEVREKLAARGLKLRGE